MSDRICNLKAKFSELFGSEPTAIVKGPGRVDLMGIHTDYNGGFVLPVAVNMDVIAAGRLREDRQVRVFSQNFDKLAQFSLDKIEHDDVETWSNYVRGVAKFVQEFGIELRGADIALNGNVPLGSGMSSSAAIEMATGRLFQTLVGFEMSGVDMALIGQKAENKFVGVNTGIMDQFISRLGKKDHALFIDCRSLEYEQLPLNTSSVKVIVCDTKKPRGLVDSEYDLRRSQCEEAVKLLGQWIPGITQLRDVSGPDLEKYGDRLPEVVRKRAEHVVSENDRVVESKDVLNAGDFEEFGRLMNASHDSARDFYEVSCAELEAMVEVCRAAPGALSARLAGAGFGGCTVSLVRDEYVEQFVKAASAGYENKTGLKPSMYVCTAEDGAGEIRN